jgi:CMP-N-acetylneuraminic acid synthetase
MSVLLVVPARGGSVGIPKKATRLLGDKPVILWTLETIRGLGTVLVTTDDAEIAELAARASTQPLMEPYSDGARALDHVVHHVVQTAPYLQGINADPIVATVQCTCPFLTRATVERCLHAVTDEGFDTALTVRDDRGLRWERAKLETTKVNMPARLTRQQMPPTWRETGGCLVTKREYVTPHCRIGPRVKLVPVEGAEALDLDTMQDWMLAELYAAQHVPA